MARPRRPAPEPSDHDEPEPQAELPADGLEGFLQANLSKTPWWIISVVFHGALLGLLATITFAHEVVFPDETIIIRMPPRDAEEKLVELERPRDVFKQESLQPTEEQVEQPKIFFPDAEESTINTNDVDQPFDEMVGVSEDLRGSLGDSTGIKGRQAAGAARSEAMGVGEGGGKPGAFGNGRGSDRNRRATGDGGPVTESAVEAGLRWLARHQGSKGGWACEGFGAECAGSRCSGGGAGEFDVGVTGLSLLAFLGSGYTHLTRTTFVDLHSKERTSFGKTVKRGLEWLMAQQGSDGCLGPKSGEHMYNHAIGALALVEAYGLTKAAVYKEPSQRAIDFLVEAQNPGLGWRYSARPGANDTSVTGWAVMALKSALLSGLTVPRTSFDGARAWLDRVTDPSGTTGYTALGTTDVFVPGKNEAWRSRPSMTAIGLLLRIYIDTNQKDPLLAKGAKQLVADLPVWDEAKHEVDSYYWYYATLALFQYQDGGGLGLSCWKQWNAAMKQALVPSQKLRKHGCADGSWDPEVDRWGFSGGRVYVTAVNVMSLEVYYRYERVFGKAR
jgi:hypothetical protein